MRGVLSSVPGADFGAGSSRTSPSPSAAVARSPSPTPPPATSSCLPTPSSEPQAEGAHSPQPLAASNAGPRDVKRSTIYAGSSEDSDVARKRKSKGCHHSRGRRSAGELPSGFVPGSSRGSSRPPGHRSTTPPLTDGRGPFASPRRPSRRRQPIGFHLLEHRVHHAQQPPRHRHDRLFR